MNQDLRDFLKKYSTVPNKFIDSFYEIQTNNMDTKFKMDLDMITKWLDTKKGSLKETLERSYNLDIDYTIEQYPNKGRGGIPTDKIYLTTDCFKRLSMLTKSPRGELVRSYYIQLEELLDRYKDHIIHSMNQKIKRLENNQKPKVKPNSGLIYVFKTDKDIDDMYRIGRSKSFIKRLLSHNSSHSDDVELVFTFETEHTDKVESCIKAMLKDKQYRRKKEVYQVDLDMIKQLLIECEKIALISKSEPKKFKQNGGYYIMIVNNQKGGTNEPDYKYLYDKYKTKYLLLKHKINQSLA